MSSSDRRRALGLETEYGVAWEHGGQGSDAAGPAMGAVQMASALVAAYKQANPLFAPWDYGSEDPLADARGFHLHTAASDMLTNAPPAVRAAARRDGPGAALLANGARLYVDHAHPEYATPETSGARDAALWDKAGELVMARAAAALQAQGGPCLAPYKNNTDGKGASYGTHENYLVSRAVPWADLVAAMTPFLVTRTVFTGSGRVGLGPRTDAAGFQLSQRADFVEAEVGLETTLNRPIVNTRDEPHADPSRWRRLHVIVGDATMMDVATYLRVGVTGLVLDALEAGALGPDFLAGVRLAAPVAAFQQVSRDLSLRAELALAGGGAATAVGVQRRYLDAVRGAVGAGGVAGRERGDLLRRWEDVLDALETDPAAAAGQVEWLAKHRVLDALRRRDGLDWSAPKLRAADLRWTDVRPAGSLFARVAASGAVEVLFDQAAVEAAADRAPSDTRAWTKGEAVRELGHAVVAAGWDSLTVDGPSGPRRVALPDPLAVTRLDAGEGA